MVDCGFLLVIATFVLKAGPTLAFAIARHRLVAVSLLIGLVGCAAAINGYLSGNDPNLVPADLRLVIYYFAVWPIAICLRDGRARRNVMRLLAPVAIAAILWGMWDKLTHSSDQFGTSISIGPIAVRRLVAPLMPTFLPMTFGLLTLTPLLCGQKRGLSVAHINFSHLFDGPVLDLDPGGFSRIRRWRGHSGYRCRRQSTLCANDRDSCFADRTAGVALDVITDNVFSDRLMEASSGDDNVAGRIYESRIVLSKISDRPFRGERIGRITQPRAAARFRREHGFLVMI